MFFIIPIAWLVGVLVSLYNGNRKLPLSILAIGVAVLGIHFTFGLGVLALLLMAVLAIIIWIANKLDMN